MKLERLTDISIEEPKTQVVIQLPNGQLVSTLDYKFDLSKKGDPIIIIKTGRKL